MALLPPLTGSPQAPGAAGAAPGAPDDAVLPDLGAYTSGHAAPTPEQQAAAIWKQTPGWQRPLMFASQGINAVGTGLDHLLGIKTNGPIPKANYGRYAAPPGTNKQASPAVWNALDAQHPGYNYLVKWPTELAMSAPGGEAAGGIVDAGAAKWLPKLPEGANLLMRGLYRLPGAMARGAAYAVQQPGGSPGWNALAGAVTGPVFEGGTALAGKVLGATATGAERLFRRYMPLSQDEIDSRLSGFFRKSGLPASVAPKATPEGVALSTAAHSGDPRLLDLQASVRAGGNATPFHELAGSNNAAIVNGLQQRFAPQADSSVVSTTAHDLLQAAQRRAKAAVSAAYEPFDAVKGGVYLERAPVQNALREAYSGLLPAHQEGLPAKLREVMEADHPLHLTSDIEDLSARLSDAVKNSKVGTTAARAAMIMRDALNKGVEDAPLANQPELGALTYDPARNPLPGRNMAASDPSQDSILQWLAKHPRGLSSDEGVAQGLDPADMRSRLARVGIRRAFRAGGMGFDEAAEALHQAGYPVADERGNYDPNALLNALDEELRGRPTYSVANSRQAAEMAHEGATAVPPSREEPDLMELAHRAIQVDPQRAQAALDSWVDDEPETLARVRQQLQEARAPQGPNPTELWKGAKAANKAFRDRFPQGTARDTEARQWLSRWLSGRKDSSRFLTEALISPARSQAVLDSLADSPAEQEQMRGLLRNGYVNRLLSATREGIPGTRTLNADALTRARANNSAIERVLLNPQERAALDSYVQAAHGNQKILQRLISGSSETAALLKGKEERGAELLPGIVKHAASALHPVAGILAHFLPDALKAPDTQRAVEERLVSALLNPDVYNKIANASPASRSALARILSNLGSPAQTALTRSAMFGIPRQLGPALSAPR